MPCTRNVVHLDEELVQAGAERRVEVLYTSGHLRGRGRDNSPNLSLPHLVPGSVQLGGEHPGQHLLGHGEVAGEERRERVQAGGEVGTGQAGEVEGGGQAEHGVKTWWESGTR